MKIFQKFFKGDQKLNANEVAIETEGSKYQKLDIFLNNISKNIPKFIKLLDSPIQAPNSSSSSNYGELLDNYTNYDILLVRVSNGSGGGEGSMGIMMPNINGSFRIQIYALETYWAQVTVDVRDNNKIGIRTISSRGWGLSNMYISSVYGIKF